MVLPQEGALPLDATLSVRVASAASDWLELYSVRAQDLIAGARDLYIRGTALNETSGFAYISENYALYNDVTPQCDVAPTSGFIAFRDW